MFQWSCSTGHVMRLLVITGIVVTIIVCHQSDKINGIYRSKLTCHIIRIVGDEPAEKVLIPVAVDHSLFVSEGFRYSNFSSCYY